MLLLIQLSFCLPKFFSNYAFIASFCTISFFFVLLKSNCSYIVVSKSLLQYTEGGPIIGFQVENEYGVFGGNDQNYLLKVKQVKVKNVYIVW